MKRGTRLATLRKALKSRAGVIEPEYRHLNHFVEFNHSAFLTRNGRWYVFCYLGVKSIGELTDTELTWIMDRLREEGITDLTESSLRSPRDTRECGKRLPAFCFREETST